MNERTLKKLALAGSILGLITLYIAQQYVPIQEQDLFAPNAKIQRDAIVSSVTHYEDNTMYELLIPVRAYGDKEQHIEPGDSIRFKANSVVKRDKHTLYIDEIEKN